MLNAALEIIDSNGVDGLTMRRLGHALGRDPMALYRYAANKNALLDGVVELVMGQARLDPTDPDWPASCASFARDFRDVAIAHPHVVPLMVTRPLATPLALRPLGTLRPLERPRVAHPCRLLRRRGAARLPLVQGLLFGHVLDELQELVDNPEEPDDLLRLRTAPAPDRGLPPAAGLASALTTYDGAAELEEGLDILIDGLRGRGTCPRLTGGTGGCLRRRRSPRRHGPCRAVRVPASSRRGGVLDARASAAVALGA